MVSFRTTPKGNNFLFRPPFPPFPPVLPEFPNDFDFFPKNRLAPFEKDSDFLELVEGVGKEDIKDPCPPPPVPTGPDSFTVLEFEERIEGGDELITSVTADMGNDKLFLCW
jgi:hypothetical protein